MHKKSYQAPQLQKLGTAAEMTQTWGKKRGPVFVPHFHTRNCGHGGGDSMS